VNVAPEVAKSVVILTCETCKYKTALKTNFTRHCSSNAHLTACNLPLPPKKPTKRERDAEDQRLRELEAKEAARIELLRLGDELRLQEAASVAFHLAENARLAEELRLRDVAIAIAAELAKPKCQIRKELWEKQAAAKLIAKELDRADRTAYREKREATRAIARLQSKEDKKVQFLEKCKVQLREYVLEVCSEEQRDIQKMEEAPNTLLAYSNCSLRIGHYLSAYHGYVPESHIALMQKASKYAMESVVRDALSSRVPGEALADFDTERGKKHLTRLSEFHSTFKPKPWLPPAHMLKFMNFEYEGGTYNAFYSYDTRRVYDYDVTIEIGRYNENYELIFAMGMPTAEVLENS